MLSDNSDNRSTVELVIGGVSISMLIDSGASCNVINEDVWKSLQRRDICCTTGSTNKKLYAYGSKVAIEIVGKFTAEISVKHTDKSHGAEFLVARGMGQSLLGRKTALQLGVSEICTARKYVLDS